MNTVHRTVLVCLPLFFLLGLSGPIQAAQTSQQEPSRVVSSQELARQLKVQSRELSRDLREIHRELAALRADLDKPGLKDVFSGIGYILGLFGVAAFVAARRKE